MFTFKVCLFDINTHCVFELCKCPFHPPPLRIFLEPPSMEELESRLRGRGTETEESLARRLAAGETELASLEAEAGARFDHVLLNDDLEQSYSDLKALLDAEGVFPTGYLLLTPAPSP